MATQWTRIGEPEAGDDTMNRTANFGFDLHPELRTVTPSAAADRSPAARPAGAAPQSPRAEPLLSWRLPASVRRHRPPRRS